MQRSTHLHVEHEIGKGRPIVTNVSRDSPASREWPKGVPHLLASGLDQLAQLASSSASALTIFLGDAPDSLAKR